MYAEREVFSNTPLEFVAAEVRFPYAPRLRRQETIDDFIAALREFVPIVKNQQVATLEIGPAGAVGTGAESVFQQFDRDQTSVVTLRPTALTVETTDYPEYPRFRELLARAVDALGELTAVAGVERVGLRYIDEVRVPSAVDAVGDWQGWVDANLVSVVQVGSGYRTVMAQGIVQYETGTDTRLLFRYGALSGPGVVGDSPLRRKRPRQTGPFFLVDLDSYWQPDTGGIVEFSPTKTMETFDRLHAPAGTAFQRVVTEKLKTEVLRRKDG